MDSEYTCNRCGKPLTDKEKNKFPKYPYYQEHEGGNMWCTDYSVYCKECLKFINKHGSTIEEYWAWCDEEDKKFEKEQKFKKPNPVHQWLMKEEKLSDEQLAEIRRKDKLIFSEGTV